MSRLTQSSTNTLPRKGTIIARSIHSTYTAADRYERRATRRQRPAAPSRKASIIASIQEG